MKTFADGGRKIEVLRGVELKVAKGERVAIVGASGSGKSTLLHLLGGLDAPTAGEVRVAGESMQPRERRRARATAQPRARLRLPVPSPAARVHRARERRDAAARARSRAARARTRRRRELLERVGLGERLEHRPGELSGGERQRAAVARALVTRPAACSPTSRPAISTGRNAAQVFELMLELNRELGTSLVVVTHDPDLARRMDRVLELKDGLLQPA